MLLGLIFSILTATYSLSSTTHVEASGDIPEYSTYYYARSAEHGQKGQITAGNSTCLTLTGWDGKYIISPLSIVHGMELFPPNGFPFNIQLRNLSRREKLLRLSSPPLKTAYIASDTPLHMNPLHQPRIRSNSSRGWTRYRQPLHNQKSEVQLLYHNG